MENTNSKVWFITGSSRGLGRALAEEVLAQGHRLVATARDRSALASLIQQHPDRALAVDLDVMQPRAAEAAVRAAVDRFGRIDVVVNNAGYANRGSIEDFSLEDFREQLETNFFGAVYVTRAALPILRAQRSGTFLQISSIGGRRGGTAGLSAYQSAKFALEGFSEVLASEVQPLGVRVVIVEPGGFRTDWAGASMKVHDVHSDYEGTVGALSGLMRKSADTLRGDPAKAAKALLQIADAPNPPRRLLLGTDALFLAKLSEEERRRDDTAWRELSASTDSDGLGDFADTEIAQLVRQRA
jgi:NAD(P)-dependent dehydrogenase (short-subunit alcohol dehydrogenase family)